VETTDFDPEVYEIEKNLIDHIISLEIFASKDPMFMRIFSLFITRRDLTQKRIKQITNLSTGKISEEINQMLRMGLIRKKEITPKGKITYTARSAGLMFINYTYSTIRNMLKWEEEISKIKVELDRKKPELGNLTGFEKIYEINEYFLDIIERYKHALSLVEEETRKY
jgi:DNA-binding transcriptional regulator GbsR (MarR family)